MDKTTHVAILPSPGMGHLTPLVELANRLSLRHDLTFTFIIPTIDGGAVPKAQLQLLESLPKHNANQVFLPPVRLDDLPKDSKAEAKIFSAISRSLPSLREVLKSLTASERVAALVVDLFGTDAFDVASEFNIPPFVFFTTTALSVCSLLYLPTLDREIASVVSSFDDLTEPVKFPGCIPIWGEDLPDPIRDRKSETHKRFLRLASHYGSAKGLILNTCTELEGEPIKAMREDPGLPPVYPVGPVILTGPSQTSGSACLRWLDEQPRGSVLFVSFGSGGTLSSDQTKELAAGLETSGQRFLWAVKSPNDEASNAAFFSAQGQTQTSPLEFLPRGFLERTGGRGLVVSSWVPQVEILGHEAAGGFLTHCGWNSILESIVHGVPMVAWPLYAEQKMNAVLVAEDLKVAMRLKRDGDGGGLIRRERIGETVKNLMEGEEGNRIRVRIRELKKAVANAYEDHGSSTESLNELVFRWREGKRG